MTIQEALDAANNLTGAIIDEDTMIRWLSDVDGQLTVDFYKQYNWDKYTSNDTDRELLVPHPWDELYVHYLAAMTYYTNGAYDRYNNAMMMYNNGLNQYRKFYRRTHRACAAQ